MGLSDSDKIIMLCIYLDQTNSSFWKFPSYLDLDLESWEDHWQVGVLGISAQDQSSCQTCCHLAQPEIQSVMRLDFLHISKAKVKALNWGNAEDSVLRSAGELHLQLLLGVQPQPDWLHRRAPTRTGEVAIPVKNWDTPEGPICTAYKVSLVKLMSSGRYKTH